MQLSIYLCTFSSTCFGLIRPSSGAMDVKFFTYTAYGVLGVVCWCVCWWRVALLAVQNATSTHTSTLNQGHHMLYM